MRTEVNPGGPLVVAVVLNWNKAAQTAACVQALKRQMHPNLRILVVDNGSTEEPLAPLFALTESVTLLRNERNLGFTGGVNIGIGRAIADGAEFVWLVNNDAEPAANALALMLVKMQADPGIGLASPVIRNADAAHSIEFCGGVWLQDGTADVTDDPALYAAWQKRTPDRIWLVGTALLLRRQVVEAIGLFDDRFFAYWEDNDYSMRSNVAGFRNIVVPEAEVLHWSGAPTTEQAPRPPHYHYYMARNEILFLRKHLTARRALKPMYWAFRRQLRQIRRLRSAPISSEAVAAGLWDGLCGRSGGYDARPRLAPWRARILHAFSGAARHRS